MSFSPVDYIYMARALELARRGLYTTDPNPRVGCVILRAGEVVGEGWHQQAGGPHAEILALRNAGDRASGATLYVTLEPCCHQGRTPPCTQAVIAAGVSKVVVAMTDPNPRVAGQGLTHLRNAGILVEQGVCEAQAKVLNPGFILRMMRRRPWVRVKLAMSLDGRTALPSGESQWITGEAARADVQRLRARSSAILTGRGTLLADNPSLNVRLPAEALEMEGEVRQPLRVILDTALRTPRDARVFNLSGHTLLFTSVEQGKKAAQLESLGADICRVPKAEGGLDLDRVMDELARRQVNEVQVEAGPTLCGALLEADLVDELVCYMAPHLMGDAGRGLFRLPAIKTMAQRIRLEISDLRTIGTDFRITARPAQRQEH